jgi:hypothetical protein
MLGLVLWRLFQQFLFVHITHAHDAVLDEEIKASRGAWGVGAKSTRSRSGYLQMRWMGLIKKLDRSMLRHSGLRLHCCCARGTSRQRGA